MIYKIADFLTDEHKRLILAHRYIRPGEPTGEQLDGEPVIYSGALPVSADDLVCPLAYIPEIDHHASAPGAMDVAMALNPLHRESYEEDYFDAIGEAAAAFIDDWDAGLITDLAAALGLAS